jgi:stringent starvation protein B
MNKFKSRKYHLIKAIYEWCLGSELTPYIVVDLQINPILIPPKLKNAEEAIFNLGLAACKNVDITSNCVHFSTRFQGVHFDMLIPLESVIAIFPHELGPREGITFGVEKVPDEEISVEPEPPEPEPPKGKKRGHLTVVK